jgi:Fur family ferric uptake transcriptional regulator
MLEHGYDSAERAALMRDLGPGWAIEQADPGTAWVAVPRDHGVTTVITAPDLATLRIRTNAQRRQGLSAEKSVAFSRRSLRMNPNPPEQGASLMPVQGRSGDVHGVVERRLRRIDQRYTAGRRAIIGLLASAGHPVSISDITERLPGLPRSSAYRHLTDLQAAGVVRRVTANDEFTRFELAEDLTEHHHHLLCLNCGKVTDVTLPAGFEQDVAKVIALLADAENFQAHSHRLDVLGVCAECR